MLRGALRCVGMALAVLAATLASAAPASAGYDSAACVETVNGSVSWDHPLSSTPAPNSWTMTLGAQCTGTPPYTGGWSVTVDGSSTADSCAAGAGQSTLTTTRPGSSTSLSAAAHWTRYGPNWQLGVMPTGSGGFSALIMVTMPVNIPCPPGTSPVSGSAGFAQTVPDTSATAATAAQVAWQGTLTPGIPTSGSTFNSWTGAGTAIGKFNGVVGACSLAFSAATGPDTLTSGSGSGTLACNGAGINFTCNFSLSRVVGAVDLSGTCSGTTPGTLTGRVLFDPYVTGNVAAYAYSAVGDIVVA